MPPEPRLAIVATVQQAITVLLTTYEPEFLRLGHSLFVSFATILIVWQGVRIMLTHDGTVSEGSSCNLFLLRKGKLATPAVSEDILEGITRNALIDMVREEFGMAVEERRIDRTELYAADEIFMSGDINDARVNFVPVWSC